MNPLDATDVLRRIERIAALEYGMGGTAHIEFGRKLGIPYARVWFTTDDGPRVLGWEIGDPGGERALHYALERVTDEAAARAADLDGGP